MRISGFQRGALAATVGAVAAGAFSGCAVEREAAEGTVEDFQATVVRDYLTELFATGDPVAAEMALFDYYTDEQRDDRAERLQVHGEMLRAGSFTEQHPDFSVDDASIHTYHGDVLGMEWETDGCGGVQEHRTAFLVDVEETDSGGFVLERFSHDRGCSCAACTEV